MTTLSNNNKHCIYFVSLLLIYIQFFPECLRRELEMIYSFRDYFGKLGHID
jgi:hypothetical protein